MQDLELGASSREVVEKLGYYIGLDNHCDLVGFLQSYDKAAAVKGKGT